MANASIKPAATGRFTHHYNPVTVASLDFGDFLCSRIVEVEKSDDWNFEKCEGTLRLAPQKFPAYGKNTLKTAAFFVPASQLVEYYDQIRNNEQIWKGKAVRVVKFRAYQINELFHLHLNDLCTLVTKLSTLAPTSVMQWDFVFVDSTDSNTPYHFYKLTASGRKIYKVFKMLGYDFASYAYTGDWSDLTSIIDTASEYVNAFPLLAFLKVYVDYFLEPQFYNNSPLVSFLQHIHDDEDMNVGNWVYSNGVISTSALYEALISTLVPYEKNMYLEAWNSPNSTTGVSPQSHMITLEGQGPLSPYLPNFVNPNNNAVSQEGIDSDQNATQLYNKSISGGGTALQGLTQLGVNFLKASYLFVRRNGLFGSKPLEQLLARFGIKASDWYAHFAHKLYEGSSEIDYSAVVSQTDSVNGNNGKSLGAYAGFGAAGLKFNFKYKASDSGYLIVLHWLQITPINKRGFDPATLRVSPMDWYTPEYDGKTIRAIPQMEVSVNKGYPMPLYSNDRLIFGFTDIYEEYRNMRDSVVGDFVLDEGGVDQFYFGRDLSYWREHQAGQVQFKPKMNTILYMNRYGLNLDMTNPFQASPNLGDRFYLYMRYKISAKRNISSKAVALDLNGEGDMDMQLGGTQIS